MELRDFFDIFDIPVVEGFRSFVGDALSGARRIQEDPIKYLGRTRKKSTRHICDGDIPRTHTIDIFQKLGNPGFVRFICDDTGMRIQLRELRRLAARARRHIEHQQIRVFIDYSVGENFGTHPRRKLLNVEVSAKVFGRFPELDSPVSPGGKYPRIRGRLHRESPGFPSLRECFETCLISIDAKCFWARSEQTLEKRLCLTRFFIEKLSCEILSKFRFHELKSLDIYRYLPVAIDYIERVVQTGIFGKCTKSTRHARTSVPV